MMECTNCGSSLRPTAKICIKCGTPVSRTAATDDTAGAPPTAAKTENVAEGQSPEGTACKSCGNQNVSTAAFCEACGTQLTFASSQRADFSEAPPERLPADAASPEQPANSPPGGNLVFPQAEATAFWLRASGLDAAPEGYAEENVDGPAPGQALDRYASLAKSFFSKFNVERKTAIIVGVAAIILVLIGAIAWRTHWSVNRGPASEIRLTGVNVARDLQSGEPVDLTATLAAPAAPVLFIRYAGAASGDGDHIKVVLLGSNGEVDNCPEVALAAGEGTTFCRTVTLSPGAYSFQVSVNGAIRGTYPFQVTPAPPAIAITEANVARAVQDNVPVDVTATFYAPANPNLFIRFTGASPSGTDRVTVALWDSSHEIASCNDHVLAGGDGTWWCYQTTPLDVGSYEFRLTLNGSSIGTYPFTVTTPGSSIRVTTVNVARELENGQPVDLTAILPAPARPVIYVKYNSANTGADRMGIVLRRGSDQIFTCREVVLQYADGNVWCQISNPLSPGDYSFQLSVNGHIIGNHPFRVTG